jgi:hypothetical protein
MMEAVDPESVRKQIDRLDTDWRYEQLKHMLPDRYRRRYVPERGMSVFFIRVGAIFSAVSIPLFAVALIGGGLEFVHWLSVGMGAYLIWFGVYARRKAIDYQHAFADYLRRRAELLELI